MVIARLPPGLSGFRRRQGYGETSSVHARPGAMVVIEEKTQCEQKYMPCIQLLEIRPGPGIPG